MDLAPTPEQDQLVDAFGSLYRLACTSVRVREAEETGFDPQLWEQLAEMGAVVMGVPDEQDGWGASLLDLALVAETSGRYVAPAPLIETQVAARLLARLASTSAAAATLLAAVLAGEAIVTMALHPAMDGMAPLVPAGSIADTAIVLVGDDLVLAALGDTATPVSNTGALPLADVAVAADAPVLASGHQAVTSYAHALDEWRALTACALVGMTVRSLEIAVEYVKVRKAFGREIGGFQAVAHRLADAATAADGAELLAREAAWAAEGDPERFAELAALSLGFAAETAREATQAALHFHGGYGFMLEYDIQLYWRRARAWGAVLEEPRISYALAADRGPLNTTVGAA